MKKIYLMIAAVALTWGINAQTVSTFEDLTLSPSSFLNASGAQVDGDFSSGKVSFPNVYQSSYGGYWSQGWAYSSVVDDTTAGSDNLYASYAAGGYNSAKYGVGQIGSILPLLAPDMGKPVKGLYVTNGTFAALSMKNGDIFAKKFGGTSGNDPDYFVLIVKAYSNGTLKNDSVNFYLADYRFANNTQDYIIKSWTWVDLSSLGNVDSLVFSMASSDAGQFGINTPTFFCVDDVITNSDTADFENLNVSAGKFWNKTERELHEIYPAGNASFPSVYNISSYGDYWGRGFAISNMTDTTTAGSGNQYSARPGAGYNASATYAVSQNNTVVTLTGAAAGKQVNGFYVTNSTFAALSMKNGDMFAKKFGGTTGNDADFFLLTVKAYRNGSLKTDSVNFYLADYRSADSTKDYIVTDWRWVDLTSLGDVDSIRFSLSSSDVGQFGMNTPAYFCLDNFTTRDIHTGIASVEEKDLFSVYPNPAKTNINISGRAFENVTLRDLSGKAVLTHVAANGNMINIAALPAGIYLVQINSTEGTAVKKLVIE